MNTLENIYHLKKDGGPVDLYKIYYTINFETGKKTAVRDKIHIKKAIVHPELSSMINNQEQQQAFQRTDKPKSYGGYVNTTKLTVIVDKADLPKGYVNDINDYLIVNGKRYEIGDTSEYDDAFIFSAILTEGQKRLEIFDIKIKSKLILEQEIVNTL